MRRLLSIVAACLLSGSALAQTAYVVPPTATSTVPGTVKAPTTATASAVSWNDGTTHSAGADTSEDILATVTIPAGSMGTTGCITIQAVWSYTNSANNKTLKIHWGTTNGTGAPTWFSTVATTTASAMTETFICNNADAAHQNAYSSAGVWAVSSSGTPITSTQDTTQATYINFTGQKASSGETLSLLAYRVEE